jgi:hypothetical protein
LKVSCRQWLKIKKSRGAEPYGAKRRRIAAASA